MKIKHILVILTLLANGLAVGSELDLQFSAEIETANDQPVLPDRMVILTAVKADPNNLLHSNLLQPPAPPDYEYTRISLETVDNETRSQAIHDPNTMLLLVMNLSVSDVDQVGITGKSVVTLDNPEALDDIAEDMLVYLRRFDKDGNYVGNYDLTDPANEIIKWQITDQVGKYATLELIAEKKTVAADLDNTKTVDLSDFAAAAASWQNQLPLDGIDVYKDAVMDINDILVIAAAWLNSIN